MNPLRLLLLVSVLALLAQLSLAALSSSENEISNENGRHLAGKNKKKTFRVLFIGNSLTSWNNLPKQFQWLAKAAKKNVKVFSSFLPASTLGDHANSAKTLKVIRARKYSHVVLQEQSYYLARGSLWARQMVWPAAEKIASEFNLNQTKIVLYETMAYENGGFEEDDSYENMQQRIIEGYEGLRQRLGCETAHVGKTWMRARIALRNMNRSDVNMLYADTRHPTARGTFLAASTIYAQIFKLSPLNLKPRLHRKVSRQFSQWAKSWVHQEMNSER